MASWLVQFLGEKQEAEQGGKGDISEDRKPIWFANELKVDSRGVNNDLEVVGQCNWMNGVNYLLKRKQYMKAQY